MLYFRFLFPLRTYNAVCDLAMSKFNAIGKISRSNQINYKVKYKPFINNKGTIITYGYVRGGLVHLTLIKEHFLWSYLNTCSKKHAS